MLREQPADLDLQLLSAGVPGRGVTMLATCRTSLADPQRSTRGRVRDPVVVPLGDDELGHGYRPIASSTQRATERLSTSRCIRSSVFSFRSRASSARSDSLNTWPSSSRSARALRDPVAQRAHR